ncbi:NEAT domain-containing protein [Peptoniphilus vaginalis]|uniref:NEAT domain-containing protein n=1 Tax=Peptoniphilus vaginalis TaxID=1756987 RepID=UPI0023F7F595|nr:NEAT domain-containing protein [Peptoniphilus vaginalis]
MKNISKNIVVAGLGLAIIASGSVFAEGSKTLSDNNSLFGGNLVKEASLRDNYLDYKNLPQGEYNVEMKIMNSDPDKKDRPSMMNKGVVSSKVEVDSNGQYWLHITMKKIKRTIILKGEKHTFEGYMEDLKYYDKNQELKDSEVLSWQKDLRDLQKPESDLVNYPKEVRFKIDKPTSKIQSIKIKVYASVMEKIKKGMGTQDAIPTINWDRLSVIK